MSKPLTLIVVILTMFGLSYFASHGRADTPTTCSWTGDSQPPDPTWSNGQNWACAGGDPGMHAPTANDTAVVGSSSLIPDITSDATALGLDLSGALKFDNSATLTVVSWISTGGSIDNSTGTLVGAGEIGPGITNICSQLNGSLTVDPAGELKVMPSPCGYVYTNGAVTVQSLGKIDAATVDGYVWFQGNNTLINNGAINLQGFYFSTQDSQTKTQHVGGSGSWSGSLVYIDDLVTLNIDNDLTFDANLFSFGSGLAPSSLAIGTHAVTVKGGTLSVGTNGSVVGSGTVHARDGATIENGNLFSANLEIDNNISPVRGIYTGTITIANGASLASESDVTANGDVILNGTLDGVDNTCTFTMRGASFTNNGTVNVNKLTFYDPPVPQHLSGNGAWTPATWLSIQNADTHQTLNLDSDVALNVNDLSLGALNLGSHTLTLTGPSTIDTRSDSSLLGTGTLALQGAITITAQYANPVTPAITVNSGTTTVEGGVFNGPVTVASGAILDIPLDGNASLNGNLTVDGALTDEGSLTFGGASAQTVSGNGSLTLHNLSVDNTSGVEISVPGSLDGLLTLNGDITASAGLTLTIAASTAGTGDAYGTVTRNGSFSLNQTYSFGNPDTSITFTDGSSLPQRVTLTITRQPAPGLNGSIGCWYHLAAVGGGSPTYTLRLHYGDRVLDGVIESTLNLYARDAGGSGPWAIVSQAQAAPEWNYYEISGLSLLNDWGIAGTYGIHLPMLMR